MTYRKTNADAPPLDDLGSFGKRLRFCRLRAQMTQAVVAKKIGVSQANISELENDVYASSTFVAPLAELYDVSAIWLAEGKGEMVKVLRAANVSNVEHTPMAKGEVQVISLTQAGDWQKTVDNHQPGRGEETIPTTIPIKRHTYALRVKGDSMTSPSGWPSFPEGMIIIVEPEMTPLPGDFVIVKNGDNEATFKQLIQDGPDTYLKPLNPRYPLNTMPADAQICGVVRGYGGMIR